MKREGLSTSVVVFNATEKQLSMLDVSVGPCVAAAGQRRPIKSQLMQDGGETPEQADARVAREKGIPLYFWFGPAVPMRSVVASTGRYPRRS